MDTPTGAPPKVRITQQLIAEWEHDAKVLLDANCGAVAIIADLRERGCTPLLAKQIVVRVTGPVRARHRLYGLLALAGGSALALVCWWLLSSNTPTHLPRGKGSVGVGLTLVFGIALALLGAWKLLSGSALDMETTLLGTADSDLDQGR